MSLLFRATTCAAARMSAPLRLARPALVRGFATANQTPPPPPKETPAVTDPWDLHPPTDAEYEPPVFRPVVRADEATEAKRSRLLWQSRKRGILECDLILSTFAANHLATLSRPQLEAYDALLTENDWDIYYWATFKKTNVPEHINREILGMIQEVAKNHGRKILKMPELDEYNKA
ncbi:Succinate dehydrogenase assembly factor 2 mitochondrial [Blastocladiella emersonii ATCC 22665]|nr:Succinate dehydrogenase assembly factor 2 mitochondrial [Blastocladiella emersonii ATCC 22665]